MREVHLDATLSDNGATMKAALKSGIFCMVVAVAVSFTRLVGAAPLTLTWSGGTSGNLSDETWSGGVEGHLSPQSGDTLEFSTGGTFTSDVASLKPEKSQYIRIASGRFDKVKFGANPAVNAVYVDQVEISRVCRKEQ